MSIPSTLLLRLQGPMQSWGTASRFDERDTQLEPSKSGVIGLVCAALGRDRREPIDDLAALRMGVRVDREGALMSDYHTAMNIVSADAKRKDRASLGRRYYLSDAVFLVGLEGEHTLLERCYGALRNPVWPLALGRKSFVPRCLFIYRMHWCLSPCMRHCPNGRLCLRRVSQQKQYETPILIGIPVVSY